MTDEIFQGAGWYAVYAIREVAYGVASYARMDARQRDLANRWLLRATGLQSVARESWDDFGRVIETMREFLESIGIDTGPLEAQLSQN